MGDRTPPPNNRRLGPRRLQRGRRRRMRTPSPDSRDNEDSESALRAPSVRRNPRVRRNIMGALNRAARNNNTHHNENDDTIRDEDRPDYNPDDNQAQGGGEDVNRDYREPVLPELKF